MTEIDDQTQSPIRADQVQALAPDASSVKAGESLAVVRKWLSVGRNTQVLWGQLKGSGSQPYQTRIWLADFTSACTCPSRKLPCKHALGLLFLLAHSPQEVPTVDIPPFVQDWLNKRAEKAANTEKKLQAKQEEAPTSAKAQADAAKREAARAQRIADGLDEFTRWLHDLTREGFTAHNLRHPAIWEQRAKRLNDAQLPGLARRMQELGLVATTRESWLPEVVAGLGQLNLALVAYQNRNALTVLEQYDLQRFLGAAQRETDISAESHLADHWLCLGERIETHDQLTLRRTWLWGIQSQRPALLLTFAVGNQPLAAGPVPQQTYRLTLGFYPSNAPLRAALISGELTGVTVPGMQAPSETIAAALHRVAEQIGRDPWTRLFPLRINARLGTDDQGCWWLADASGDALPIRSQRSIYEWLALSQGEEAHWFGEWNGTDLHLLGGWR